MQNKTLLLAAATILAIPACSTLNPSMDESFEQTEFMQAQPAPETSVEVIEVPVPAPMPMLKKLPEKMVMAKKVSPQKAIADARREALKISTPEGFLNAMQVFEYMQGALYEIYASPGYITTIMLKPGETVIDKATGDASFWDMGETTTGMGKEQQTVLILRPKKSGIRTNMMITTNQRIYMLEARSIPDGVYNASVSWSYPADDFKNLKNKVARAGVLEEQVIAGQVNIHNLNYDYIVKSQRSGTPRWMPEAVFDDNNKTYIRFSNDLGKTKSPVLYVLSNEGETEIVNYRVRGNFYVLDRLIDIAELRLGRSKQEVVRITRKSASKTFTRSHSSGFNS